MDKRAVMTVKIDETLAKKLDDLLDRVWIGRDTYLNRVLLDAIAKFEDRPKNSDRAAHVVRLMRNNPATKRRKLGLKLSPSLIERITGLCNEKQVPRDLFIQSFLSFLAYGYKDPEGDPFKSFVSPLAKAATLLEDPFIDAHGDIDIFRSCFRSDEEARLLGLFVRDEVDVISSSSSATPPVASKKAAAVSRKSRGSRS